MTRPNWVLALPFMLAACGGGDAPAVEQAQEAAPASEAEAPAMAASSDNWIEYAVTGDFAAEGRDADVVICSIDPDEGRFLVAARGAWFMDVDLHGSGAGEHPGRFTVTVPEGEAGAPSSPFARRLEGDGSAIISEAGAGPMGLPLVEVEFVAPLLANEDGQSIGITGSFRCAVM